MFDKVISRPISMDSDDVLVKMMGLTKVWLDSDETELPAEIYGFIMNFRGKLEDYIFGEDSPKFMEKYLPLLENEANDLISKGLMRPFGMLDIIDSFLDRAVEEECIELRAWLMDYKGRSFDDEVIDEADMDKMDLEFEMREAFAYEKFQVGNTVNFGQYEGEPLSWRVLDLACGRALLISDKGIESLPYNEEWAMITWEECTIRKWLGEDFFDAAFTDEEKPRILTTRVLNCDNDYYHTKGGNDTDDKVFLLSIDEVKRYFDRDPDRRTQATEHVKSKGAYVSGTGNCCWWLRSRGYNGDQYAGFVYDDGVVYVSGDLVYNSGFVVRPVIWVEVGGF